MNMFDVVKYFMLELPHHLPRSHLNVEAVETQAAPSPTVSAASPACKIRIVLIGLRLRDCCQSINASVRGNSSSKKVDSLFIQ